MKRPFVLGLTGSIGMGKSAVAQMLGEMGVPVFDADACVRSLQGPGAVDSRNRGRLPGTTGPEGVDRAKLGSAVFGNDAALTRLESIVHPAVAEQRAIFLAENSDAPLVVFDIPCCSKRRAVRESMPSRSSPPPPIFNANACWPAPV
jgi:dephospho-CoA kinase